MSDNEGRIKPHGRFLELCNEVLKDMANSTSGIDAVLVASTDGFKVDSIVKNDYDEAKLAAVASSILSLVQALTREAHLSGCRSVILDAPDGKIMISAVPNKNQPMIAMVLAKSDVMLAGVMHGLKKVISEIVALDEKFHSV